MTRTLTIVTSPLIQRYLCTHFLASVLRRLVHHLLHGYQLHHCVQHHARERLHFLPPRRLTAGVQFAVDAGQVHLGADPAHPRRQLRGQVRQSNQAIALWTYNSLIQFPYLAARMLIFCATVPLHSRQRLHWQGELRGREAGILHGLQRGHLLRIRQLLLYVLPRQRHGR